LKTFIENQKDKNLSNKMKLDSLNSDSKNKEENDKDDKSRIKNVLMSGTSLNDKSGKSNDGHEDGNKDNNKSNNEDDNTFNIPANQTLIDLISQATNPHKLSQLDIIWMPYY